MSTSPVPLAIVPYRALDTFIADAVVEEQHDDELVLTDHPVEQGATITDHAYKRPASVRLTYGWSGGSPQADNDPDFLQSLYQQLLELQASRVLFDVYTGKRRYTNMLLVSLRTDTTRATENSLIIYATCRELLLANTQTVTIPNKAVQTQPEKTAPVVPQGQRNLNPAPNYNAIEGPLAR